MTVPLAALAAGCGGSNSSSPSTVATPTVPAQTSISKDQFIKEGDGICAEVNAALGSLSSGSASSASLASQRATLYQGMISRLRGSGVYLKGQRLVVAENHRKSDSLLCCYRWKTKKRLWTVNLHGALEQSGRGHQTSKSEPS